MSFIYLIRDEVNNSIKLGVSVNPDRRIKQLQTGSPNTLILIEKFEVKKSLVYKVEKECHIKLGASFKKRGEWFHCVNMWHVNCIIEDILQLFGVSK